MRSRQVTKKYLVAIALALIAWSLALVVPTAHAQNVTSLACSPSTIGGGSGGSATCTVGLSAAAPAGGTIVTLTSSLIELAASVPRVTVPAGQTAANFSVTTNARYRRYSLLAFSATISATANGTTQSATLNVTAQPRPADFDSGSQENQNTQWQGLMCGGIAPIGGNTEILYDCSPASASPTGFGSCTFRQECSIGCRRVPPSGGTFNDFCATSGPNPIAVSRNYFVSGDHVPASVITEAPVTIPTTGVPRVINAGVNARSFSPADVGGLHFPTGIGATSMGFDVATSYVPGIEFVDVGGFWYDADIPPFLITNGRGGHTWAVMLPPVPAPAQPIPTPVQFKIVGSNPVTGGQSSLAQVHLSGIPHGIGPTITLTSSHPAIASVPASITPPASNILGFDVSIATQPPAADTNVTITATDGRYTFSAILTVLVPPPPALLAGVSVNPTSVAGGASATGTVTLSAAQTGPTVVQVSIVDAAPATLPSNNPPCPPSSRCYNVTVPASATSANFTIATSARTAADGQFNLNIFANLPGSPERQALLLITPGGALALKTLALNPVDAVGGISRTGTVTLTGAAPAGGVVVTLSRDNTAATVPASVTVAAGQTSASFTVTTRAVTATTVVRVSAAFNGVTLNADMTLFTLLSQVLFPGNVPGGTAATGTVTLGAAAPSGGAVLALYSANTALVTVPASVTVPAGQTSATFTANTASVTTTTGVVVSASLSGTTVSTTLFLVVSRAVSSVTLNPSSVANGNPSTATVTLRTAAPSGNAFVSLASSNSLLAVVPDTVIVPGGRASATFTVNTAPVSATSTVVISATHEGVTQSATLTLNPSASTGATLSAVSLNPSSVVGGSSSNGTVTLSAAAPSGGAAVALSDNSSASSVPVSVTVPAGATSANFTVTTTSVTASTSVSITGSFGGTTRSVTLTVTSASGGTPTAPSLVSPANDATVAQPVTFDWSNVANATSYEIQVDDSSTIAAPFRVNQIVNVSQVTLGGLPAQRLWWRVRARNSAGVFGPFSSTRRFTPQATATAATLSALSVNPSSVVGPTTSTGTVTLTAAAPSGGATVTLSSSNPAVASVPASVTVAAGASSASFTAATSAVSANTGVTLTGAYNGASRTATLTVTPAPPPASLNTLTLSPTSVTGGATSQGTVTLTSAAPSDGAVVSLSDNSSAATPPASVTVPAGATGATFTVTTSPVTASTPVTISAVFAGVTRTAALTVNPPGANVTLTVTATGRSGERVTSSPAGINVAVGSTQSAGFAANSSITLSVSNGRDAIWSGACSSSGNKTKTCTFTITGNAAINANVQ